MLEIEQKFADADFSDLEQRLTSLNAKPGETREEVDHYFNAPDRNLASTDEVFRLRRVNGTGVLTYKGPKRVSTVKVRAELEVPLASGDKPALDCLTLLSNLGYRPVAVVRKVRRPYFLEQSGHTLTVTLDEVDNVGRYAEVEILAPEEHLDTARAAVMELANTLGLSRMEKRSYLGLFLAATKKESP